MSFGADARPGSLVGEIAQTVSKFFKIIGNFLMKKVTENPHINKRSEEYTDMGPSLILFKN